MSVNSVGTSGTVRNEQVRNDRRAQETRDEEAQKRTTEAKQRDREPRQAPETEHGENIDVTV